MLSTPHILVGLAIAKAIPNPIVSIPLSFCSHFALEVIPHWNPHLNTEIRKHGRLTNKTIAIIILDTTIGIVSAFILSSKYTGDSYMQFTMLASALSAIAPDIFEVPYFFFHTKNALLSWWLRLQKSIQSDAEPVMGIATQIVTVLLSIYFLLN